MIRYEKYRALYIYIYSDRLTLLYFITWGGFCIRAFRLGRESR